LALRSKNYLGDPGLLEELDDAVMSVDWEDIFTFTSEAQRAFVLESSRPLQAFIGARGVGKTFAFGQKGLYLSLRNGSRFRDDGTLQMQDGYIWARKIKEAKNNIWPYFDGFMRKFRRKTGIPLLQGFSASDGCYTLVNGHRIWITSYGNLNELNKNRGPSASWIGVDEAAWVNISADALLAVATPSLRPSDGEPDPPGVSRQLFVTTSPDGRRGLVGWFVSEWEKKNPHVAMWGASMFDCSHITPEQIEIYKAGTTPESYEQEVLGRILRPAHLVYGMYRDDKNLKPLPAPGGGMWAPSKHHYWGVGIDWGEVQNAYVCFVDIDPATGEWVTFWELHAGEMAPAAFRREIAMAVSFWEDILGRKPDIWGSDRALAKEHQWVESEYGPYATFSTHTNKRADEQRVQLGIRLMSYMICPLVGQPRMKFSERLSVGLPKEEWGIRDSIGEYRYVLVAGPDGKPVPSRSPESNSAASHACDGHRYLVLASKDIPELHGGRALSEVVNQGIRAAA